jgi:hypothetical protein
MVGPATKWIGKGSFSALELQRRLCTEALKLEVKFFGLEVNGVS